MTAAGTDTTRVEAMPVRPLDVEDLRVSYGGDLATGVLAVSIPRLHVDAGECVAIVGESGSGKTTLLNAVLGLLPRTAVASGRASLFGVDAIGTGHARLATVLGRRVGLIMQNPVAALNPVMTLGTIFRHVHRRHAQGALGGRRRFGSRDAAVDPRTSLAQVGLDEGILSRYPHQISGGQAQRFSIALILSLGVDLIVADEPTSALDMIHQAEITELLAELRDRTGLSLLLVSHDLAMVSHLADRVIILQTGRVIEAGPTLELLRTSTEPYTRELIAAVPRLRERRPSIDGSAAHA
ncbi:ABC transporter ATP-binding protein [Plantibacter flavus]|uniref:ATP-binding cassette domain-containing protein n=1 Tax=Plantibacter flavus TaxID=150123 RepID=UPI003F150F0F